MNRNGADDSMMVLVRCALLDALVALAAHRDAIVVVGAQAVYLHTGGADVALAEMTKDSDLAVDRRVLREDPRLESALTKAGFRQEGGSQPGAWISPTGVPVDLMVPEAQAGPGSRRSGKVPPHDDRATRRTAGLEAAVVDSAFVSIASLDPADTRTVSARVAGPAALLVAKAHKIGERIVEVERGRSSRLEDKDAHDVYRLLVGVPTEDLAAAFGRLLTDPLSQDATVNALRLLDELFGVGSGAVGSQMAGRAERGIGEPELVAQSVAALARELLDALR